MSDVSAHLTQMLQRSQDLTNMETLYKCKVL